MSSALTVTTYGRTVQSCTLQGPTLGNGSDNSARVRSNYRNCTIEQQKCAIIWLFGRMQPEHVAQMPSCSVRIIMKLCLLQYFAYKEQICLVLVDVAVIIVGLPLGLRLPAAANTAS